MYSCDSGRYYMECFGIDNTIYSLMCQNFKPNKKVNSAYVSLFIKTSQLFFYVKAFTLKHVLLIMLYSISILASSQRFNINSVRNSVWTLESCYI